MANKKFSEFELKTTTSNVSHIVGYNGAENVRITPANFLDTTGGPYLPLAGGLMVGNTTHNDNVKSIYGSPGNDLQIYHDSNDSYIDDAGTGDLYIKSNKVRLQSTTGENLLFAQENSGVFVYYNNAKKFETTSTGISVTGNVVSNAIVEANGFRTTTGSTDYSLLTRDSSNTAVYIQQAGSGDILDVRYGSQAAGQGTSAFVVNSSGNSTFAGTVLIDGVNSFSGLEIKGASSNKPSLNFSNANAGILGQIYGSETSSLIFATTPSGTTALTLDASQNATFAGNVTVGSQKFLKFGGNGARIYGDNANSLLTFDTNSLERMRLDASGNLGIGTSSPLSFGTGSHLVTAQGEAGNNYGGFISRTDNVTGQMWATEGGLNVVIGSRTDHPVLFSINNQEKIRIDTSGNLGIGTASPIEKLTVFGQVCSTSSSSTSSTSGANRAIIDLSGGGARMGHFRGGDSAGSGFLKFYTDSVEKMRIDNTGNVGIGTSTITNPYGQTNFTDLNIDGVWGGIISFKLGGTELGYIGQRNSGNGGMVLGSSSGQDLLFNTDGNNERMRLTSAGALAVGTTSVESTAVLQVEGSSGNTSSYIIQKNTNAGASAFVSFKQYSDGGQCEYWRNSSARTGSGGANSQNIYNSNGKINFWTGGVQNLRLQTDGDLELLQNSKGLILKSANGTAYKITVADNGTVTSTAV